MKNNAKKDLSIKSMLLFNKIDMEVKNLYNLSLDVKKRAKALDHIIDTYRLVLNPFLKDEDKDFMLFGKMSAEDVEAMSLYEYDDNRYEDLPCKLIVQLEVTAMGLMGERLIIH